MNSDRESIVAMSPFAVTSQRYAEVMLHSDRAFEKIGFNATYYVVDKYSKGESERSQHSNEHVILTYKYNNGPSVELYGTPCEI